MGKHNLLLTRQFIKHLSQPPWCNDWNEKDDISLYRSKGQATIEVH